MGGIRSGMAEPAIGAAARGKLAELLGVRVFQPVTIPRTKVTGQMRLLSRSEDAEVDAGARAAIAGLPHVVQLPVSAVNEWNAEVAIRTLAIAVRDPDNHDEPLDTLEEWRALVDDDQVNALYIQYKDLQDRLDPLGPDATVELDKAELAAMRSAAKKKAVDLLMSYGSQKLALFAITSDEPPAS